MAVISEFVFQNSWRTTAEAMSLRGVRRIVFRPLRGVRRTVFTRSALQRVASPEATVAMPSKERKHNAVLPRLRKGTRNATEDDPSLIGPCPTKVQQLPRWLGALDVGANVSRTLKPARICQLNICQRAPSRFHNGSAGLSWHQASAFPCERLPLAYFYRFGFAARWTLCCQVVDTPSSARSRQHGALHHHRTWSWQLSFSSQFYKIDHHGI